MNVQEIRQQFPQHRDLSDKELVDAIHAEYYSATPIEEYYKKINFSPEPEEPRGKSCLLEEQTEPEKKET